MKAAKDETDSGDKPYAKRQQAFPDGRRKRRHSPDRAKAAWYATHRSLRFAERLLGAGAPAIG